MFDLVIDFEKSQGSYLVDKISGQHYLDFFSFYSSLPIGYNHPIFDKNFESEILKTSKVRMANNAFSSNELKEFIDKFKKYVFSEYIHFTCTGALAVESAIKCAMEYKKVKDPMVLGVKKSFHGINSWGFVTDRFEATEKRMDTFPSNNWKNLEIDKLKKYLMEEDCSNLVAVVIEPIQCTAGDIYLDQKDLIEIQNLCNQKDVCFILDEIQTGFGTTGSMWYYQKIDLTPDILVFGKKTQICGLVASEKYKECITGPNMKLHVTFDGELLDAIRAKYIIEAYEKDNLVKRANVNSAIFKEILSDKVLNYRSEGHLIAFDFQSVEERDSFINKCFEKKLLCNKAGSRSIRMRPSLAITKDEIDSFRKIMDEIL
jgi:L-lysine 6-transaminase